MALIKLNNQSLTAVTSAGLPSGTVLQVKSVTMTGNQSFAGTAFTDITDGTNPLSISITPSSSSSKFLLSMLVSASSDNGASRFGFKFLRDSTSIGIGETQGNRVPITVTGLGSTSNNVDEALTATFLDSPATTSSITYKIQGTVEQSGSNLIINRSNTNANNSSVYRPISSLTVMEIAG